MSEKWKYERECKNGHAYNYNFLHNYFIISNISCNSNTQNHYTTIVFIVMFFDYSKTQTIHKILFEENPIAVSSLTHCRLQIPFNPNRSNLYAK
jgi:hypothetical protein